MEPRDRIAAIQLLISLVEELRDDHENVDPSWIEQVLASCRLCLEPD